MRADWQDLAVTPVLAVDATLFAAVVVGVVALGVIVALGFGLGRRDGYEHVGGGGLWSTGRPPTPSADDQRDEEIRQMRSALRARGAAAGAGTPGSLPGAADSGLVEEVRQVVLAADARRRRQGLAPLDPDAEVARRLRDAEGEGGPH